jgi:hypothetical protein
VRKLIDRGYDLFINLCDGPIGRFKAFLDLSPFKQRRSIFQTTTFYLSGGQTASVEVVEELEKAGVAYTGSNVAFWDILREEQKRLCR